MWAVLLAAVLFAAFIAPANAEIPSIKIGVIAPLTGIGDYQGRQALRGLELANEEAKIPVKLIVEDSQADPKQAVSAYKRLVHSERVAVIIGDAWNSSTVPLLPLSTKDNVLLISPAAGLDQLSLDDLFFRTMPSTSAMMDSLARYARCVMHISTVSILYQDNPFGLEHRDYFRSSFEKLGGKIPAAESFKLNDTDLRAQLLRVSRHKPEAILNLHASGPPLGLMIFQGKALGINTHWLSHFGAENSDLVKQYPKEVAGLTYPYQDYSEEPSAKRFRTVYQQRFGELPELIAANSFDALKVVLEALRETGKLEPDSIKKYLLSKEFFDGAAGRFRFNRLGDVEREIAIKRIVDGSFQGLGTAPSLGSLAHEDPCQALR